MDTGKDRRNVGRSRGIEPGINRGRSIVQVRDRLCKEALARGSQHQRLAKLVELVEVCQQRIVLIATLAESNARIEYDAVAHNTRRRRSVEPLAEVVCHHW